MATLTVQDAGLGPLQTLKGRDANQTVTVDITGAVFGDYAFSSVGDAWYIYGPDHHPVALALTDGVSLASQTFTPKVSGRYLVVLVATTNAVQETLTALYEVDSAYASEAIPAPKERDEYTTNTGWSRALEEHMRAVHLNWGGRTIVRAKNVSAGVVSAGELLEITGYVRYAAAAENADAMSINLTDVVVKADEALATAAGITSAVLVLALEDIAAGAAGPCLLRGLYPANTSGWTSVSDPIYAQDNGTLGSAAGTHTRQCGYVVNKALSTMATDPAGILLFEGDSTITSILHSATKLQGYDVYGAAPPRNEETKMGRHLGSAAKKRGNEDG